MAALKPTIVASTVDQVWARMLACCGVVFSNSRKVGHSADGWLVNSGLTTCARGSTSHNTRNRSSRASCAARTARRPRRSRRSHARYAGLGPAVAARSAFDMDFELLPEGVEVAVELAPVAGRQGRGAGARPAPPAAHA